MNMKSITFGVAGLCFVVFQPTCANAEAHVPGFVRDGKLVVCTNPGNPPMTYMASGSDTRPAGIDIEIADALGKLWNAETSYSTSEFAGLLTSLASGRCGMMISSYYASKDRVERNNFDMAGYLRTSTVIVTDGKNTQIKTPDDLSGKSVTIEAGTTIYENIVEKLNAKFAEQGRAPARLSSYPSQSAAAEQVLLGRADANLSDLIETSMREKQTGGKVKIAYAFPPEHIFAIYIVKNADNLLAVREGLRQLLKDGTFAKIAAKYGLDEIAAKYGLGEGAFSVPDEF